jgi:hypothetical protein
VQAQEEAERSSAGWREDPQLTQDVRTSRPVEPAAQPEAPPQAQHTQALIPDRAPVEEHRGPEDSGGLGGLFASTRTVEVTPQPRRELPPELRPRASAADVPPTRSTSTVAPAPARPPGRRRALLAAAAFVVLAGLVAVLVITLGGRDSSADQPGADAPSSAAPSSTAAAPAPGATQVVDGTTFTLQATDTLDAGDSCAAHAYGSVEEFFGRSDCTALTRSLWSADVDGQLAVVSVARVTMPDAGLAEALKALADTDGSGNVDDLLRDGVRYANGPVKLSDSEYDSGTQGDVAVIVETSYVGAKGSGQALDALAATARALGQSTD